ncbi:MAG: phage virion morphogenesis protein [Leptolyngbyaceae cyanobacterium CSU_1_4]|nr:phage virion morphogenesis protein [Leptolyngbyaceae cyanobacterium CSU_1_4]
MAEITVTVDDAAVQAALKRMRGNLTNLRPAMKQIGEYMVFETDENFRGEHDPEGNPWKKLDPDYLKWKQRTGKITKILQLRGRLRKSIVYRAESDRVSIGTNVIYGNIHQWGGKARSANLPARPFLGVTAENEREMGQIIMDFLRSQE